MSPDNLGSTLKNKLVLSFSLKQLTVLERKWLQKGFKLAFAPSKIPNAEIVPAVQEGI